jgi:hypothetical protein
MLEPYVMSLKLCFGARFFGGAGNMSSLMWGYETFFFEITSDFVWLFYEKCLILHHDEYCAPFSGCIFGVFAVLC